LKMDSHREYNQRYYQANKEHLRQYSRDYYQKHRAEILPKMGAYHRNHRSEQLKNSRRTSLTTRDTNGKVLIVHGLNKRAHPGCCEICGVKGQRLSYHHWEDGNYNKGIWVCFHCHILCEFVDERDAVELINKYKVLTAEINRYI